MLFLLSTSPGVYILAISYNTPVNYKKYLALQTRLEWFYDFHPGFFDDIPASQKELLQRTFLYDAPDDGYPESIRKFYDDTIAGYPKLQHDMRVAVDALYRVAGAGKLTDYTDD
mgnify:FL=1